MQLQFTPPAPLAAGEDPFSHIFRTKAYLDGLWPTRPEYVSIRFGREVKFSLITNPRMQIYSEVLDQRPPMNWIWGIPIIEDLSMADGFYTITFVPPVGSERR